MDRLIAPNSVDADHADTAPATGTPGFATDGNPATGVPATFWPSYQYNAIQEELIAIIDEGSLTPSKETNTQVRDAVLALFAKINGDATKTFSVAPATAPQHAVQFGQLTGIVGTTRNSKMQVGTASAAGTWACDWVIVETSAGLQYRLSNLSLNLNLATVGAGGMDTGAAPNAGYCGLYIIYNPTTATAALLAQTEGATALPEIYAGGNAPTGYTASALIGYFGTTAATPGLMKPHALQDRHVGIQAIQVLSTSTVAASPTLFSLSPAIPKKANRVFVTNILQGSTSSTGSGQLFTTSTSIGPANQGGFNSNSFASSSVELFIIAAQTAFYTLGVSAGTITYTSTVNSFNF